MDSLDWHAFNESSQNSFNDTKIQTLFPLCYTEHVKHEAYVQKYKYI